MAIPQGRMSTSPEITAYRPPEGPSGHPITSFERGPIAVEDTSEGLQYQNWMLQWDAGTGVFTLTPETTGSPVASITIANVLFASFTFDQAGRVSLTYVTTTSSYLYWYDTDLAATTTTDLGSDVITPVLHLDDKRETQSVANDMLLWFTRSDGGDTYTLFMARQRDRFLTEYEMATGLPVANINALGMTAGLRIRIGFAG